MRLYCAYVIVLGLGSFTKCLVWPKLKFKDAIFVKIFTPVKPVIVKLVALVCAALSFVSFAQDVVDPVVITAKKCPAFTTCYGSLDPMFQYNMEEAGKPRGGGTATKGRGQSSAPKNVPPGTKPVDQVCSREAVHAIKSQVGLGPSAWTGITAAGEVLWTGADGKMVNEGHFSSFVSKGCGQKA
jgi:hypothetical protein